MIATIDSRLSATAPNEPENFGSREGTAAVGSLRILIVDENRVLARGLSHELGIHGHEVRRAHTGISALKLAHAFQPEFALVNVSLPDLSGYEVAALLPGVIGSAQLRIASVSSRGSKEEHCLSQAAGCVLHLETPVEIVEIEALLAGSSFRRRALTPPSSRLRLLRGNMPPPIGNSHFPTTRWTRVLHLLGADDLNLRKEALATLCQDYWYPLYAFARRLGRSREDAEDLTQGFFAYALEHDVFNAADRNLGTLRTFLLRVFQRYIGDVWDREHAQKRGGGKELVSLNLDGGEELYSRDLAMNDSPELLFDRSWAQTLLRAALSALAASEQNAARGQQFELFQSFLTPDAVSEQNYEAAARVAGMAPEAVRQAVCRLRKKFRECLREQIATTLQEPDDTRIDAELSALRAALRG